MISSTWKYVHQEFFGYANSFMQPRGYGGAAAGGPVLLHQQQWLLQRNEKLGWPHYLYTECFIPLFVQLNKWTWMSVLAVTSPWYQLIGQASSWDRSRCWCANVNWETCTHFPAFVYLMNLFILISALAIHFFIFIPCLYLLWLVKYNFYFIKILKNCSFQIVLCCNW